MKFLFENQSFSFETLRTAGFASYGGADLGEILVTARAIPDGDETAWHTEWTRTAERVARIAVQSLEMGHTASAREAFLRACNYYRTAERYLREDPAKDPEVDYLSSRSRETFASAAALMGTAVEPVAIPYEGTTLSGYFFGADSSNGPRPTVVYSGGFDSTLEESYFAIGAAAMRRGYNVLAFDGPGQGAALRDQALHFRHDWEEVLRPVIDVAQALPEVAPDRIALVGCGLGGYFAARAAAFEHRIAALVLHDGVFDYHDVNLRVLPRALADWVVEGRDDVALPMVELLMSHDTGLRQALRNGRWAFGASSFTDYIRRTRQYSVEGIAESIGCRTLILDAENDRVFRGEAQRVAAGLTCPKKVVTLTEAEGAGEPTHAGAMARSHQVTFDWLDETMRERSPAGFRVEMRALNGALMLTT